MAFHLTVLVVILYWISETEALSKNYELIYEGLVQEDDVDMNRYVGDVKAIIQRISHEQKVLNGFMIVDEELPLDAIGEIAGYEKNGNVFNEAPSFKYRKNYCDFLENDQVLMPPVRRYSNLVTKCPVVPNNYTVTNYVPQEDVLPPRFPGAERWKICARLFHENLKFKGTCFLVFIDRSKSIISKKKSGGKL